MRQPDLCDGCGRPIPSCPVDHLGIQVRTVEVIFDGNSLLRAELCNDCRKRVAVTRFGLRRLQEK